MQPGCPRCGTPLDEGTDVLPCPGCGWSVPVVHGIPLLVADLSTFVPNSLFHLVTTDVSAEVDGILGEACGPDSAWDVTRAHLSTYVHDHYEVRSAEGVLDAALTAVDLPDGPALDLGCGAGGLCFRLARDGRSVLGIDMNVSLLRAGRTLLDTGSLRFPFRDTGLRYDWRTVSRPDGPAAIELWCADAQALPLADATFAVVSAVHTFDSIAAPRQHLSEAVRVLRPGGILIVASAFDWSTRATAPDQWVGGSPALSSEEALPALLAELGLQVVHHEDGLPWSLRVHARCTMQYRSAVWVLRKP